MGLLHTLLSYIEAFLGWLFRNFKGRDSRLFTRSAAFKNVPQSIRVTSALGASGKAIFPIQYTQEGTSYLTPYLVLRLQENMPKGLQPEAGTSAWPNLLWGNLPEATQEVLVVVQDADVPIPQPILHSCLYGIPVGATSLTEADVQDTSINPAALRSHKYKAAQTMRKRIYSGPRPILEHGSHRYFFQVIALAKPIRDIWDEPPSLRQIATAVEGEVLGWGEWIGTYERRLQGALIQPKAGYTPCSAN